MTGRIVHSDQYLTNQERRQRDHASTYRPDNVLERLHGLSALAESGNVVASAELAAMSPAMRLALGYFSNARAAAVELGTADPIDGQLTGKAAPR